MQPSLRPQRPHSLAVVAASLVILVAAGLALAAGTAARASASTPCSQKVINDWFDDDKIDQTYPQHCYTEAIQQLPRDVHTYSNAADDIRAAMLAALKKDGGTPTGGSTQGSGGNTQGGSSNGNTTPSASPAAPKADEPKQGVIVRAIEWLGPSDAGAVPLPLLILAGVAFLLLAAAGGSLVNRRLQERRLPPPPQA